MINRGFTPQLINPSKESLQHYKNQRSSNLYFHKNQLISPIHTLEIGDLSDSHSLYEVTDTKNTSFSQIANCNSENKHPSNLTKLFHSEIALISDYLLRDETEKEKRRKKGLLIQSNEHATDETFGNILEGAAGFLRCLCERSENVDNTTNSYHSQEKSRERICLVTNKIESNTSGYSHNINDYSEFRQSTDGYFLVLKDDNPKSYRTILPDNYVNDPIDEIGFKSNETLSELISKDKGKIDEHVERIVDSRICKVLEILKKALCCDSLLSTTCLYNDTSKPFNKQVFKTSKKEKIVTEKTNHNSLNRSELNGNSLLNIKHADKSKTSLKSYKEQLKQEFTSKYNNKNRGHLRHPYRSRYDKHSNSKMKIKTHSMHPSDQESVSENNWPTEPLRKDATVIVTNRHEYVNVLLPVFDVQNIIQKHLKTRDRFHIMRHGPTKKIFHFMSKSRPPSSVGGCSEVHKNINKKNYNYNLTRHYQNIPVVSITELSRIYYLPVNSSNTNPRNLILYESKVKQEEHNTNGLFIQDNSLIPKELEKTDSKYDRTIKEPIKNYQESTNKVRKFSHINIDED